MIICDHHPGARSAVGLLTLINAAWPSENSSLNELHLLHRYRLCAVSSGPHGLAPDLQGPLFLKSNLMSSLLSSFSTFLPALRTFLLTIRRLPSPFPSMCLFCALPSLPGMPLALFSASRRLREPAPPGSHPDCSQSWKTWSQSWSVSL